MGHGTRLGAFTRSRAKIRANCNKEFHHQFPTGLWGALLGELVWGGARADNPSPTSENKLEALSALKGRVGVSITTAPMTSMALAQGEALTSTP
jgi:hypothetical protein